MAATEPVFSSVHQALSFSFMVEQYEMAQKSNTQTVIEDLMKQNGEWLDRPARSERSINMGGLGRLEVRAQCAMVRAAVQHHLHHQPERAAIHARFAYQMVKAEGVRDLRDYCLAMCTSRSKDVILALIWAIYRPGRRKGDGWSLKSIEKDYGVAKSILQRDQVVLRGACTTLENMALGRLGTLFEDKGLVGDTTYA